MSNPKRVTNDQIVAAYREAGSVWKAAKALGICGQSVWERLRSLGIKLAASRWTSTEIQELNALAQNCTVGEIGRRLGRSYAAVACKVSELQIGVRYGNSLKRKLIRGPGITKAVARKLCNELANFGGSARRFCVHRGLDLESFVLAVQRHDPQFWESYVASHSELAQMDCPQCRRKFIPMSKKQRTCSRRCAGLLRTDLQYFGGKRTFAVGLAEGICQLCEKEKKSLSAHHIFGKENDQGNDFLIALCRGCHQLVSHLGGRKDVELAAFWENLISLAIARRLGPKKPLGFHVAVDIDELSEEEARKFYGSPERVEITVSEECE